ncbi:hypothetical protein McanMca71_005414 [Microsporum canis]|uniref:Uncharacterized protein n=1 Tax=Arthroderma otae (strain ATCC MYA-4605 / CBS 113480) TaxID=554155 RepID=C5FQQ0_ARTOC|nr:conserved hypothetical protein [Microsporum canis CBS 113480]EEQ32203.1 conserved hypothetical protein [Microsporum canis CBS 113480]
MVDVRELLRNELASRHLPSSKTAKKRRHGSALEPARKKARPFTEDNTSIENESAADDSIEIAATTKSPPPTRNTELDTESVETQPEIDLEGRPAISTNQEVDENEWAAFEREVAQPSRQQPPPTTSNSTVTISAAPVSAAELDSRERQDRESLTKNREAALLGDREDATRFLEEEFDEMEELDRRVKRLKQMRDEIRRKREEDSQAVYSAEVDDMPENKSKADGEGNDEDSEYDDDEEGWDDWAFR